MSFSKTAKLIQFINYRVRITILDGRQILGRFMAFDRHMNMVLGDAEELRKLPPKKNMEEREQRRILGLVILRGEEVVTLVLEGPPPAEEKVPLNAADAKAGVGIAKAAGRGMMMAPAGAAPAGLAGPTRGVGGPAPGMMLPRPQLSAPPAVRPGGPPPGGMGAPAPMGMGAPPPMTAPVGGPPRPGMGPPPGMRPPPGQFPPPGMGPPPGMAPPGFPPGGPPRPGMGPPPGFRPGMGPPPGFPGGPPRPGMPPRGPPM